MKKHISWLVLSIFMTSSAFAAGIGSGGTPTTTPTPEPTPTVTTPTTPTPTVTPAPTPKTTNTPVNLAPKTTEKKHCGMEKTIKERVSCRLKADPAMIQLEQETAYFPEGCRRGTAEWQEACKTRYKAIGPCWYEEDLEGNTYETGEVMSCIKEKLSLPETLVPVSEYCANQKASCSEDYKKAVYHLIVARFYDAEERTEVLLEEGRISEADAVEFITFISEAKLAFYDAKTKAERVQVINDVIANWKNLVKKVK